MVDDRFGRPVRSAREGAVLLSTTIVVYGTAMYYLSYCYLCHLFALLLLLLLLLLMGQWQLFHSGSCSTAARSYRSSATLRCPHSKEVWDNGLREFELQHLCRRQVGKGFGSHPEETSHGIHHTCHLNKFPQRPMRADLGPTHPDIPYLAFVPRCCVLY